MSEQSEAAAKLSKSQKKKKKAAQKKKLAKKDGAEEVVQDAEWWLRRRRDEIDARIMDEFNDHAMGTRDFQMLNIRGKLLVHPSKRFLDALTNQRLAMGRETYIWKIKHIRRYQNYQSLAFPRSMIPTWSVGGHTSYISLNLLDAKADTPTEADDDDKPPFILRPKPNAAYADQSCDTVGFMVWYPILSCCMASGDKLACIALRDTCVLLRQCYNMFRSDITRLEQFVFDPTSPDNVKQLDWAARRIETPPSPPQTPTSDSAPTLGDPLQANDPFRFPAVLNKRWSDYDDDDESLGSPMSLPITPESSLDAPHLDLNESAGARTKTAPRRASTYVVAVPTLTNAAYDTRKTVLPVTRITIHIPEDYPRSTESSSIHPMKLQESVCQPFPESFTTNNRRTRGRIERWVRADTEQNLRAKLALTSAARKQIDSEAELIIYNKISAFTALDSDKAYMGKPDILGAGVGICVDDVRDVVLGRFKGLEGVKENGKRKGGITQGAVTKTWDKIVLVPSAEGWICKQLAKDGI